MAIICPNCGYDKIPDGSQSCDQCGFELSSQNVNQGLETDENQNKNIGFEDRETPSSTPVRLVPKPAETPQSQPIIEHLEPDTEPVELDLDSVSRAETASLENSPAVLIIQEQICFQMDSWQVEVKSHLGQSPDVHYFRVKINQHETEPTQATVRADSEKLGLLRVGPVGGSLSREMQLRDGIGDYKMVSEFLAYSTEERVYIYSRPLLLEPDEVDNSDSIYQAVTEELNQEESVELSPKDETLVNEPDKSDYLEEKFLEPKEIGNELGNQKIILLSYLPEKERTLEAWLKRGNSLEQSLLLASQVCQFFRYVYEHGWCFIQIFPQFIQMGTPVQFFDLTGAYPVGEKLASGLIGDYCPPEISYSHPIDEQMSTYVVGALLYHSIHQKLPNPNNGVQPEIKPLPRIYQIISICLSSPSDRFPLSQLLSLLVDTRLLLSNPKIHWNVAGRSTVGLSLERLENEDSYGVRQQEGSNQTDSFLLGVVADGMGGMTQGEVASRLAVQTVLKAPLPTELNSQQKRGLWLVSLVKKANECVANEVRDGGTTLSLVLAVGRELMIAHVGDSRIFLLRNSQICQLSEDHSMVAMLLASGQISYEESKNHPEHYVLTKYLGSKRTLSDGYIQDLSRFGNGLSISLENGDILLLCSDGVWDLVSADELAEIFSNHQSWQLSVDATIERVLARGAPDNATILALKCYIENFF